MDNSRGQKIKIGVFDEDKAADYESLEKYSKYASKHELVKSNSYLQFLHVCDCFDVDKMMYYLLSVEADIGTIVQQGNVELVSCKSFAN